MDQELSFESILRRDHNWLLFKHLYKDDLSEDIIREVEKMLKCCSPECGFATYICSHCGDTTTIPFSCKSKLCSRCGKKYTDIWSQNVSQMLLNCDHRHIVLTVSDKLWPFFIDNPTLQKLLLDTAAKIVKKVFSQKQKLAIGLILVLHPFGDDLKRNFHVHIITSCGGLPENNSQFIKVNYIDYAFIRKTWQYEILTALREHLPESTKSLNPIIDWCFKNRANGFVIFADRVIKDSKQQVLSYVARYTRHPPISTRRILSYTGTAVTFAYEAYGQKFTKTMPKFEFIKAVLQHTSSKHFKIVRRFGLYSRRSSSRYEIAKSLLTLPKTEQHLTRFNWRRNLTTLTDKDPLACKICGEEMSLWSITYPHKSGTLKTIYKEPWQNEAFPSELVEDIRQEEKQNWHQVCMPTMSY